MPGEKGCLGGCKYSGVRKGSSPPFHTQYKGGVTNNNGGINEASMNLLIYVCRV